MLGGESAKKFFNSSVFMVSRVVELNTLLENGSRTRGVEVRRVPRSMEGCISAELIVDARGRSE